MYVAYVVHNQDIFDLDLQKTLASDGEANE